MHAKVANSNPTNYIFLRLAINTLSIEHIKSPFFQNLKFGMECLLLGECAYHLYIPGCLEFADIYTCSPRACGPWAFGVYISEIPHSYGITIHAKTAKLKNAAFKNLGEKVVAMK